MPHSTPIRLHATDIFPQQVELLYRGALEGLLATAVKFEKAGFSSGKALPAVEEAGALGVSCELPKKFTVREPGVQETIPETVSQD